MTETTGASKLLFAAKAPSSAPLVSLQMAIVRSSVASALAGFRVRGPCGSSQFVLTPICHRHRQAKKEFDLPEAVQGLQTKDYPAMWDGLHAITAAILDGDLNDMSVDSLLTLEAVTTIAAAFLEAVPKSLPAAGREALFALHNSLLAIKGDGVRCLQVELVLRIPRLLHTCHRAKQAGCGL